jgi:hypothetical protein
VLAVVVVKAMMLKAMVTTVDAMMTVMARAFSMSVDISWICRRQKRKQSGHRNCEWFHGSSLFARR